MSYEFVFLVMCLFLTRYKTVFTPHTGFEDPSTPADAALRESIELRALVAYRLISHQPSKLVGHYLSEQKP
jgi:hypothetical protein